MEANFTDAFALSAIKHMAESFVCATEENLSIFLSCEHEIVQAFS